jgi:hypothetical protein
MKDVTPRQVAVSLLVFGAVLAAWLLHGASAPATPAGAVALSPAQKSAGMRFGTEVAARDREWILGAIADARPEAQRLIAAVDGTVEFRTHRGEPLGLATSGPEGSVVTVDVAALDGHRQVDRNQTVLHELGHVVDYVLVPDELAARLDAGIPRRGVCGPTTEGPVGACTEPAERFADTFAKWAMRGAISAVGAGYSVPTPPSLEEWGAPLAALAAAG